MSASGRCCRKSRKSNDAKNLANVDFWTTPPLRCSLVLIRRSVVVFLRSDVVPSHRCARNASAALENFVCCPQKTFSTASVKTGKAQREQMFSALALKADIAEYDRHVRLVPIAGV